MSFNKRYINEQILHSSFEKEGISRIHMLMGADALITEDEYSYKFIALYNEYGKNKDEQKLIDYLNGN